MMKRILNLLALVFLFFFSDAQTIRTNNMPNFQQFGSSVTQTRINGILYPVVGYAPAIYTDTTDANLNLYLKSIPFVQISTTSDGKNWYRNLNVTKWEEANLDTSAYAVTSVYRKTASDSVFYVKGGVHTFAFKDSTGSSTPTLQQVLTAGSTLTTDHTINFGGNDFFLQGDSIVIKEASGVSKIRFVPGSQSSGRNAKIYLTNVDEWGDGYITAGDEYLETNTGWYVRNSIGYNSALSVNGSFLSSSNPQTAPLVEVIQDGETLFQVANDSIFFRPPLGRLTIDTLNYTLSTTGKKILIRDTATGLVQNIDPSLLGGGSTPTLQQVLTAGSTLTGNNTITGGLYSFKFTAQNLWSVDTARQWRLRSFREADSSMQLIQSSNYGVSGLKRINISSQDTAYLSNIIIDHDHLTNEVYERNPLTLKTAFIQAYNRFSFQGDTGIMVIEANNRKVGIITDVPDSTLHVVGGLKFVTGRQGAGKVLTSDANGGADWATPSGGSYTFSSGVNEVAGTVKLGGTLTETTTINTNTNELAIQSNSSGDRGTIFFNGAGQVELSASSNVDNSTIRVVIDSLQFEPKAGRMNIDTLAAASNMTNKRVMTWDTVTKRWEQISKDSVGGTGGSTSPAGNYGNLQINRNGAFGSASSDSLTYTTADGLKINNQLLIKHGSNNTVGLLLRPIGASDPYTPLLAFQATSVNTNQSRIGNDYGGALNIESANLFATFGNFYGGTPTVKIRTYSYSSGSGADNATINIYNPDAAAVGLRIKGYTSATGNLFELVNSSSTGLSAFDAAGDLGIGTITPAASAKLDITSTTQGFLPPRMTGAQQNAISSPATGLMIYNTDSAAYTSYNGSAWQIVGKYLFGLNDALSSADRTFNLNNYKLDLDSGSFHIKRKVTGQRTDDIFSVGIGPNKSLYVAENGQVYATELFSGSGSFYAIGGALGINGSNINLSGNTIFQAFQKKFEINKSWPALADSIGFEIKNDTLGISTLPDTWSNTYKIASLKYRSGVDNSLTERFDFRGNGDFNITGTGATKFQSGNTAQRPSSPTTGMMRYNTDSTSFEYYNGSAWLKFGTASGGSSDGYVDNATFNTTTNYLTIEQTGAADVSVRIPPSYIRNALNADSISKKENDSTLLLKAITVTTSNNRLTTTVTRTDSTLNFLVDIKRDTVTLASFGAGGGQAGDTTAFSTSTIYGSFYNDGTDTLVITSMRGILQGTSPSVTYDVYYNDSLNVTAGASKLVTAGTALTNTATGAAVTSFDNTKIPPGVWVWVKTTTVTTKPTYFSLSLVGYKSRKS